MRQLCNAAGSLKVKSLTPEELQSGSFLAFGDMRVGAGKTVLSELDCHFSLKRRIFFLNGPPFSKCFLQVLYQMDMRNRSKGFRKYSTWRVRVTFLVSCRICTKSTHLLILLEVGLIKVKLHLKNYTNDLHTVTDLLFFQVVSNGKVSVASFFF